MKNDIVDFFKQMYESELILKQRLDAGDGVLIGIVGAIFGVCTYYSSILHRCTKLSNSLLFFVIIGVLTLVAILAALVFLALSYSPRKRSYVASPREMKTYLDELRDYYRHSHNDSEIDDKVQPDLEAAMLDQYVEAAETNRLSIIKKHGYQTRAKRAVIIAVFLMVINSVPLHLLEKELGMSDKDKDGTAAEVQNEPVKPEPPKVVVIDEGATKST